MEFKLQRRKKRTVTKGRRKRKHLLVVLLVQLKPLLQRKSLRTMRRSTPLCPLKYCWLILAVLPNSVLLFLVTG